MTDLTSLGYPQGYHLGLSSILWWIFIIVIAILGIGLYLNAKKSDLINVKEMLRAKSFGYICTSIQFSLVQIGVFFPNNFLQFYLTGGLLTTLASTFYFYYWEKNLMSIKRIPTISVAMSFIISVVGIIILNIFSDLPDILVDFVIFAISSLLAVAFALYIYLIYFFSKNVKGGVSTIIGWIWIGGIILEMIVFFIEYPPGVKIFPEFIVLYIPPIFLMMGMAMAFYGITKLFAQISSFYAQTQRCAVHRGKIEKGTHIHYCSSCGIVYCETCFNQVIQKDGCWNCSKGVELEDDKEQDIAQVLEQDKPGKHKKPPKKETSSSPK